MIGGHKGCFIAPCQSTPKSLTMLAMSEESINRLGSVSLPRLAQLIATYFSQDELHELCFHLGVDHQDLPADGKRNKARELVTHMDRRGRTAELAAMIRQLRPHIGLNIQELARAAFATNDPRLESVQSLIGQFRSYYLRLYEWKELHNHLDETLNVFGQYAAQVERFAVKGEAIDLDLLIVSWQPVYRRTGILLMWAAQDMKHIGKAYHVSEAGEKTGERWAVELGELHFTINTYLQDNPTANSKSAAGGRWQRVLIVFSGRSEGGVSWQGWWNGLRDLTRALDHALKNHLYFADKELRKTAGELHDLSKEALWS